MNSLPGIFKDQHTFRLYPFIFQAFQVCKTWIVFAQTSGSHSLPITNPLRTTTTMKRYFREQAIVFFFFLFSGSFLLNAQITNVILQASPPPCGGFSTGSIEATPIGGVAPYTYLWSTGSTDNPLLNIPAGEYTVTVTDSESMTAEATGTVTEPLPLMVQIITTDCGLPGAMASAVQGGVMPFSYEWSNGETTPAISNLTTGQYCLTVTDINSCAFQLCESIGEPMSVDVTAQNIECGTGVGGSAFTTVTGGVMPFDFEWSNGAVTDTISDLSPGVYSVTVTAENGCTEQNEAVVGLDPGNFPIAFLVQQPSCSGSSLGSITASASGGLAPFSYVWSTGDFGPTISGLSEGTYYVTASDAFGCTTLDSVLLFLSGNVQISLTSLAPTCANSNNGSVNALPSGGTAPYSYLWSNGDTTQTINNLGAGTYSVTVSDANDCTEADTIALAAPLEFTVAVTATAVSECGGADGSVMATPAGGGDPPFNYLWNNGATGNILNNVPAGNYVVTVTSSQGCTAVDSATVQQPLTLDVSISGDEIVCFGDSTGTLEAGTTQGTAPFNFSWSNGGQTHSIENLPAGTYEVTVSSSEGCQGTASAEIENNNQLFINPTLSHVTCAGFSNGSISVSIGGGTSPLGLQWSTGSNSTILNNLSAGEYSLTITDELGCTLADTMTIEQPAPIEIEFDSSEGSCNSNGFSIALASGGTQPYSYLWSNGATTTFINNLPPGTYSVTVTDDHGCTAAASLTIEPYPDILLDFTTTNTTCNGTSDGTASANPSNGAAPYQYNWNNGGSINTITGLVSGTYAVTVTDDNGCTASASGSVQLGAGLNVSIDAPAFICPMQQVFATAEVIGGAPPLQYNWSTSQNTQSIFIVNPGTYSVTATDPTGCSGEATVSLSAGGQFEINETVEAVKCFGEASGSIHLNVTGGLPPYQFLWNTGENSPDIDNLIAGSYALTVSDQSECPKTFNFNITEPPQLTLEISGTDGICGALGEAHSSVTGGVLGYTYLWSNGQTTPNATMLQAVTHFLTVTDANGCEIIGSVITDVTPPPTCSVSLAQAVSTINGNDGQLTAMPSNGSPPFNYLWSDGQTSQTAANLTAGPYSLTMTDGDGCTTECSFDLLDGTRIGDFVWNDENENGLQDIGEPGMEGINIELTGTDEYGTTIAKSTTTNAQGNYFFDAPPGNYQLKFGLPPGYIPSPADQGADDGLDSDANPFTNTFDFAIGSGESKLDIDAGFFLETNCDNLTAAGEICCDQSLCTPGLEAEPFTETSAASGGSGDIEYMWASHDQPGPFDPGTWTVLPTANGMGYAPGAISGDTYFIRLARRSGCPDFLQSNQTAVLIKDEVLAEITSPDAICVDQTADFSAADAGSGASYNWRFENGLPATSNTQNTTGVKWGETGEYPIVLTVEKDGCTASDTASINISDSPVFCGEELVLNGQLFAPDSVLLDWTYPASDTVDREYFVEWAWEDEGFVMVGTPDSLQINGGDIQYFFSHTGGKTGANFYRVRLTDSNGSELLSNTVQINIGEQFNLVHAYPNPFSDYIKVDIYDRFDLPIRLELYNVFGQLVYLNDVADDVESLEIETGEFAGGAYFLLVKYGGKPQKIFKLVK